MNIKVKKIKPETKFFIDHQRLGCVLAETNTLGDSAQFSRYFHPVKWKDEPLEN